MQTYRRHHGSLLAQRRGGQKSTVFPASTSQSGARTDQFEGSGFPSPEMLLRIDQMLVNEALVAKILQFEKTETALRGSETKLNELLAHQCTTREGERKRIAREMNDNLAHNLLALRTDLSMLHARTSRSHPRLHGRVDAALVYLNSTIRSVEQIIADMRPFQLELGLAAAVEWELNKFERMCGLHCNLSLDPRLSELVLPDEHTLALYRALQECLNNIFRHSLASRVNVLLEVQGSAVLMNVADNGIGFDAGKPRKPGSCGLLGAESRMAALGGHLLVASSGSHGTAVTLSVPVPAALRR